MSYKSDGLGGVENMQTSTMDDPSDWLVDALGGSCTTAGMRVNHRTALGYGPLWQAVTMIADDLALLPVEVRKRDGENWTTDPLHPVSKIWNIKANEDMLSFDVRQTLQAWALLYGNGVGAIQFENNKPKAVWPLTPGSVTLHRIPPTPDMTDSGLGYQYIYRFTVQHTGESGWLFPHEVFHVRGLGNARWGYSPLYLFKELIGTGLAMEMYQSASFANSARPSGVLQKNYGNGIPTKLAPEARANLRREWEEMHSGVDNTGKIAILTDGLEFKPLSMTNQESEMLQSLKYSREQIAAIYKIPPHKLGSSEQMTFNNVAEQNRSYAQQCLMPWARKWEEECREKLFSPREKMRYTSKVEMNFKELMKPDTATRVQQVIAYRQWGVLSANDVRDMEGWDDIGDQGDIYMVPSNMADAETREPFSQPEQDVPSPNIETATPADTETDDSVSEAMLAYARASMHQRQDLEVLDLNRAMATDVKHNRKAFDKWCEKYYESKFPSKMFEPLEPLANVPGLVSTHELDACVNDYATESFELVSVCRSNQELQQVLRAFPKRIDKFIDRLRAKP